MSLAQLTASVRLLVRAEVARMAMPRSYMANNTFAEAWFATVKLMGGDSRGLAGVVQRRAYARFHQLNLALARHVVMFPRCPELDARCDANRDLCWDELDAQA